MMQWINAEKTILRVNVSENHYRIVEPGSADWDDLSSRVDILPYDPPPLPSQEEILAEERAAMKCSPSQMRLALHRMGLLEQVQAIAGSDAEASIVWEYALTIERNSPFIAALGVDFTPEYIDDIFRAAMAV